jgi:hypothetical protein
MRMIILPLLAAISAVRAGPNPPVQEPETGPERASCADRITEVREAAGQPRLDRLPLRPGEEYLIAAVDKRIDGCAVMQMHRQIDDLRPVPGTTVGPTRSIPLR